MTREPSKPRVFVASTSSRESEPIALAIQENLSDMQVTLWSQGVFRLTTSSLDNLLDALADFDFAIFVFLPEDVVIQHNKRKAAVRDNLIFELGLFLGKLGKRRNFIIAPSQLDDLHLPSDLRGITRATFSERPDGNLTAALAPACDKVRRAIESLTPPPRQSGGGWFAQRIEEHAGIHSPNPVALAIDLRRVSESIKQAVENFLTSRGWTMPLEELKQEGISGTADVETFVENLREKRFILSERGATEIHLFYAGPLAGAAIVGAFFSNWIPVKVYQKVEGAGELYEYWAPLVKT
jgi:predicted nucleotide-binding protein with TIR-like domain/CBASS immunity sensor of nucleotide second messenger signals